jgi:hypothetical protein
MPPAVVVGDPVMLNWFDPAQSNSNKVRASPKAVGVRVSMLSFDSRGLCEKTPLLRSRSTIDPVRVAVCSTPPMTWPFLLRITDSS